MQEHGRTKWNSEATFRLPSRPTNLLAAWHRQVRFLASYNASNTSVFLASVVDFEPIQATLPLILPEDVTGVPIVSWGSATTLALLFPSLLIAIQLDESQRTLKAKDITNIPLRRNPNALHWINPTFLVLWNNSHFSLVNIEKKAIVIASEASVTSVSSFIDNQTNRPVLLVAGHHHMKRIELASLQTTDIVTDLPMASMIWNGNRTIYGVATGHSQIWPTSEAIEIPSDSSPMAALLSIGALSAQSSPRRSKLTLVQFDASSPAEMIQLDWEAPFSPPNSIENLVVDDDGGQLAFSAPTSPTVFLWKTPPQAGSLARKARIAQIDIGTSNTRILGLKFARSADTAVLTSPRESKLYLYALVGEIASNLLASFLPSTRDFCSIELVCIQIPEYQPHTGELDEASSDEPSMLTDLKSQLLKMAMEDTMAEDDYSMPFMAQNQADSSQSLLLQLAQQMQMMNSKIDTILSQQQALDSRVTKLSSDLNSFMSTRTN